MDVSLPRTALAAGLAGAALLAAGCGDSGRTRSSKGEIRQVVTRFAQAGDERACGLLTENALQNVYGGYTASFAKSKANCVAASRHFKGEAVRVTGISFTDASTAKAGALSADGKIAYTVTLRRNAGTRWRIDQITQTKIRQ